MTGNQLAHLYSTLQAELDRVTKEDNAQGNYAGSQRQKDLCRAFGIVQMLTFSTTTAVHVIPESAVTAEATGAAE